MNTAQIKSALRERFCAPEWALMFEVGNATGAQQRRWADAVAMNLYPSRGLEVHGFEVKASRSDWTRERKNPEKSAPVQQFCDRWWVVAPPGVVADGELPPTWGLYEAKAGKLRQVVAAPKLEAEPLSRGFVAAMMRRSSEVDDALVRAAVATEVARLREQDAKQVEREIARRTERYAEVEARVAKIKEVTGVDLTRWCDEAELGAAVKLLLTSGVAKSYGGIQSLMSEAERFRARCAAALAEMGVAQIDVTEQT